MSSRCDGAPLRLTTEAGKEPPLPCRLDDLADELLEGPYHILDILPKQVPRETGSRYFAVERYFLQPERLRSLRRRFAELLLKLSCYEEMAVSFDNGESWEKDPDPETFADRLVGLAGNRFLRALFPGRRVMIDLEADDTYMTCYGLEADLPELLRKLTEAAGLFLWSPEENEKT